MTAARFVFRNLADLATLSSNVALASTQGIDNLKNNSRARVARTTGLSSWEISAVFVETGSVNAIALLHHNLSPAATWRIQLYQTAAFGTLLHDSGAIAAYDALTLGELDWGVSPLGSGVFDGYLGQKFSHYYLAAAVGPLSAKITIADAGNPNGYLEASRLVVGKYVETSYAPRLGAKSGWDEHTEQFRSAGATLRSAARLPFRKLAFQIGLLPHTDRAALMDGARYVGKRKPFYFNMRPGAGGEEERDFAMMAKFTPNMPAFTWDHPTRNTVDVSLEEA